LEVAVKSDRKPRNHPPGTYLRHHQGLTSTMKPSDVVVVPYGPFTSPEDSLSLSSSISGYCSRTWGPGNYIINRTPNGIEVLRVG
jgi:hypothetical protein